MEKLVQQEENIDKLLSMHNRTRYPPCGDYLFLLVRDLVWVGLVSAGSIVRI